MKKPSPNFGETRIVKKFLFLPRTIDRETRWISFEKIKQEYKEDNELLGILFSPPIVVKVNKWIDVKWMNEYEN